MNTLSRWRRSVLLRAAVAALGLLLGGQHAAASAEDRDPTELKNERATVTLPAGAAGAAINPNWVGDEFHAALVVRPALIKNAKLLSSIPKAELEKFITELDRSKLPLGIDKLERMTVLFGVGQRKQTGKYIPAKPGEKSSWELIEKMSPIGCVVFQFSERFEPAEAVKKIYQKPKATKIGDGEYFSYDSDYPSREATYFPNDRTMIVTDAQTAEQIISGKLKPGSLAALVAAAPEEKAIVAVGQGDDAMTARIEAMIKALSDNDKREIAPVLEFVKKARDLKLELDLDAADLLAGNLRMADEDSAKQLADLAVGGLALLKFQYGREKEKMIKELPPSLRATLPALIDQVFDGVKIERSGASIAVRLVSPKDLAKLVPEVLPTLQLMRRQARRSATMNSMMQIGVASHSANARNAFLPADYKDATGKPLLSWRVALLPYVDARGLHEKFKLDEPWDSPHNLKLLDQMPFIYRDLNDSDEKPRMTRYVRLVGPGTPFEKGGKISIDAISIKDGLSNTVMMIQVGPEKAVPWTKPDDSPFDPADPWKNVGTLDEAGLLALFFDGSVRTIARDTKPAELKALFQHDDAAQEKK